MSAKKLKVEIFTYAFRQNFSLAQCASLLFAGGWGVGVKGLSLLPNFQKREGLRGSQFLGGGGGVGYWEGGSLPFLGRVAVFT